MKIAQRTSLFFTSLAFIFASFIGLASQDNLHDEKQGGNEVHGEVDAHDEHKGGHYEGNIDTDHEINLYKNHHLLDAHDFIFYSDNETGKHYGFPLPVILWDNETGLHFFMSSEFHHGESLAESKGAFFGVNEHGKIYKTDANNSVELGKPIDFSITKSVLGMLFTGLLMFLMFRSLAKGYGKSKIPTGLGRGLEPLVLYVRDEIARPNIGEKHYKKFMSFLLTVFFFIWILNLLGLTPLAFNVTGNIAVTACLALFTFIIVQFSGNKDYWKHIFWMPGVPGPMKILLAPIEVLGMITKPFSLMIRLFANITAGHMIMMSLIALTFTLKTQFGPVGSTSISLFLSLFIAVIEVLVAFLQAYIFTMLSSLFIGMAVQEHDHH